MVKTASMRSSTVKWVVEEVIREKNVVILNYWVYGDNSHIDKSQVLSQVIGAIWLFYG